QANFEEKLLVEEGAVQLGVHVVGRVVREVVVAVEGLLSEPPDVEGSARGESEGTDREGCIPPAAGRRPDDGEADPVVLIDEVGELADELVRLLVGEAALLAVRDERVGLVPLGVRLAKVLDVELPLVRVASEARLEPDEEPKLVLQDVAAERRSEVGDVVEVARSGDDRTGGRYRLGPALKGAGGGGAPDGAVELIASGPGDGA